MRRRRRHIAAGASASVAGVSARSPAPPALQERLLARAGQFLAQPVIPRVRSLAAARGKADGRNRRIDRARIGEGEPRSCPALISCQRDRSNIGLSVRKAASISGTWIASCAAASRQRRRTCFHGCFGAWKGLSEYTPSRARLSASLAPRLTPKRADGSAMRMTTGRLGNGDALLWPSPAAHPGAQALTLRRAQLRQGLIQPTSRRASSPNIRSHSGSNLFAGRSIAARRI